MLSESADKIFQVRIIIFSSLYIIDSFIYVILLKVLVQCNPDLTHVSVVRSMISVGTSNQIFLNRSFS